MNISSIVARTKARVASWFSKAKNTPVEPKHRVFHLESQMPELEPDRMRPTKAYADQRQKMARNRRRKPSKAMAHLYKL